MFFKLIKILLMLIHHSKVKQNKQNEYLFVAIIHFVQIINHYSIVCFYINLLFP